MSANGAVPSAVLSLEALEAEVQVAEDRFRGEQYREAFETYENLLRRRLNVGGAAGLVAADLVVIERLAELSALFGRFAEADDLLHSMAVLTRRSGNGAAADFAQMKRIELALARGSTPTAFDLLLELRDRIGSLDDIVFSESGLLSWEWQTSWRHLDPSPRLLLLTRAYLAFGRILAWLGQYQDALCALGRASMLLDNAAVPDAARRARPHIALAQALALLEVGQLDCARSVEAMSNTQPDELAPAIHAGWLELRARLDMMQGHLGRALRGFEQALAFYEGHGFISAGARVALNLAQILVLLNRVSDALRLVATVHERAEMLGDDGLRLGARAAEAAAHARLRSSSEAFSVALSVSEMAQSPGRHEAGDGQTVPPPPVRSDLESYFTRFETLALELQWSLGTGNLAEAAQRLLEMQRVFGASSSGLVRARLDVLGGLLSYGSGRYAEADEVFQAVEPELLRLSLRPELRQLWHLRSRCAAALSRLGDEVKFSEQAERLLADLAQSLDAGDAVVYLLNKATAEEAYLSTQLDQLLHERRRAEGAPRVFGVWHRLIMMRRLDALMSQLDAHKAMLADRHLDPECAASSPVVRARRRGLMSIVRRLTAVQRDSARLCFLVLPDKVLTIWTAFLTVGFAVSPVTRLDLRERVRQWHELTGASGSTRNLGTGPAGSTKGSAGRGAAEARLLSDLADMLQLEGLLSVLPARVKQLCIVPDDVLHGLPFAALPCRGTYLVERFALSIGFQTAPDTPRDHKPLRASGLVAAVSEAIGSAPALPNTLPEARAVAEWLCARGITPEFLADASATRAAVAEALQRAQMAHVACHGIFEPDRPDASGLLLFSKPGCADVLTLRDLSQMRLTGLRLVVLSSCWSADNFVLPGRWIVSLPETLQRSGAQSVLGSLWPVDDDVAAAFMSRFYAALARLPRAAALREAQLACLSGRLGCGQGGDRGQIDTRAAFYWAGFNLYGEPGILQF